MANDEVIGPRKTMFVLVIVVGCFAVLWPRILSPLVLGPTREQIQPNQFDREAGCCEVIFETDVAVLELVNEVCSLALEVGKLPLHSAAECRKAVNETCGVDIAVFLKRNENVGKTTKMLVETMQKSNSSCLREHFGVPIYSLGPHLAANSWNIKDTLKQERAPPMRGMGPHPALRERGRAIPPGPPGPPPPPAARPVTLPPHIRVRSPLSVYYEDEKPPPIPGMRPPLGSPGGPVPAPKSSMGFVMPIYTICIIVFFVYTLTKIMFRRQGTPYDPVAPDPQFRRRVFRDDSRSSPEKLGKKEADTIVTAISGLVAEVQQQMEASGAPNQQRQDVQDNTRPYTNGTILLNSGPVQIVTSEYKDAFKEKTPEPVTEKESTPEPKEAETSKVVKEPWCEQDAPISVPIKPPSPEPGVTPLEKKATLDTVDRNSSPEPVLTEENIEYHPEPKVANEPTHEPIPNLLEVTSISGVAEESDSKSTTELKESTLEPEIFQNPASKSHLNFAGAISGLDASNDSTLISDFKDSSPKFNESSLEFKKLTAEPAEVLTELVKLTTDIKEPSPEPKVPSLEPKESSPEPEELIIESKVTTLEFNELAPVIKDFSPLTKESSANPEQTVIEPKEPKESGSTLKYLSMNPLTSTIESKETSPEPSESINKIKGMQLESVDLAPESVVKPRELELESEDLTSDLKESLTEPEEPKESLLEPKDPTPELQDPSLDLLPLTPEPKEPSIEYKEPCIEPKEPLLVSISDSEEIAESEDSNTYIPNIKESMQESVIKIPEHETITADTDQSISEHKESTAHRQSTSDLIENSQEVKARTVECSPGSEFTEHSPKMEPSVVECSPVLDLIENLPKIESESMKLKEPTPQYKDTTPERKLTGESETILEDENASVPEGTLLDLEEAIADEDDTTAKQEDNEFDKQNIKLHDQSDQKASEELLQTFEGTEVVNEEKGDVEKVNEQLLQEQRFVLVRRSTPDVIEENKELQRHESKPADDHKLYTEADTEENTDDVENAAVKVMGMETTAHPVDGGEWPRDERPPPPAAPASPPPRAPHAAEEVKSIFLETEIPQQSRVLVAQFEENRPRPAAHAPLVVSGKMTLSLIQDAPRDTPDRDPESTVEEFTTASALTQPAAEKEEIESDEEIEEEIEVEEIELEEEEEEEEPPPAKTAAKK